MNNLTFEPPLLEGCQKGSCPILILHVFPTFAVGGIQVCMTAVINHMEGDFQHIILALDGDYACLKRLSNTVKVETLESKISLKGPIKDLLRRRGILHRIQPDLLMTYNWGAIDWAFANTIFPICRHIHAEHGFGLEESDRQFPRRVLFRRLALARTWRLIVPSETLVRTATNKWRLPSQKIVLIPNGVDCARFDPSSNVVDASGDRRSPSTLVVGALGPLRPEKNLNFLLETIAALTARLDLRLKIIGKGPEENALRKRAADLGIADRVTFTGHSENVADELASLDVFVLTSKTEQMPIGVLQAMAAGKIIVAPDVGDMKIMVSPDNRPLITPRDDLGAFVTALERSLANSEFRMRAGAANRAYVQKYYTQKRMVEAYEALIAESVNKMDSSIRGSSSANCRSRGTSALTHH